MEINPKEIIGFLYGLKRELCDDCTPVQGKLIQDTMQYAIDCIKFRSNYEARLKADKLAMLSDILLAIEEETWDIGVIIPGPNKQVIDKEDIDRIFNEHINALKENNDAST